MTQPAPPPPRRQPSLRRWRRWLAFGLASLVLVSGAAEWGVRAAGMIDFPVYDANATIGYIPQANQRGSFMGRNDWVINEQNMGAEAFVPGSQGNVLLVGDSVVWGGNPYARGERLGPQLQRHTVAKVWPISAGSWGLQNELTYLGAHSSVVEAVDTIVLVLNSGDFESPSSWTCELSHPTRRPPVALWYLARKYALNEGCPAEPPAALKVTRRDPLSMLTDFVGHHPNKRVLVFLYPDKAEIADESLLATRLEPFLPLLRKTGVGDVIDIGRDRRWQKRLDYYRDAVHPTPQGNAALAEIIATHLQPPGGRQSTTESRPRAVLAGLSPYLNGLQHFQ